ncbi:hypothetical protein A8D95_15230 [Burkholderia cenocepacia]|nr:hypothetical protein A8D88_33905 [Burkholderia cenocepacia]ONP63937.1 hypothetical protein A8D94_33080 [Burkholderia cenocepacia]ONQ30013.1 hypothetical protein A8D95_15230 [Burkholderia cenocepacia]
MKVIDVALLSRADPRSGYPELLPATFQTDGVAEANHIVLNMLGEFIASELLLIAVSIFQCDRVDLIRLLLLRPHYDLAESYDLSNGTTSSSKVNRPFFELVAS